MGVKENSNSQDPGLWTMLRLMISILVSPRMGWRKIKNLNISADEACRGLFYPLTALAAASNFMNPVFDPEYTVTQGVIAALETFSSFFFSFFLVFLFGRMLLRGEGATVIQSDFGKTFTAFSMSTLTVFYILYSVLPMLEPIIVLLPLWTIFSITRGIKVLRIPEADRTSATVWLSVLIVGLPVGVSYMFSSLI